MNWYTNRLWFDFMWWYLEHCFILYIFTVLLFFEPNLIFHLKIHVGHTELIKPNVRLNSFELNDLSGGNFIRSMKRTARQKETFQRFPILLLKIISEAFKNKHYLLSVRMNIWKLTNNITQIDTQKVTKLREKTDELNRMS